MLALAKVVLVLCTLMAATADRSVQTLEQFSEIELEAPVNLVIAPSKTRDSSDSASYQLVVTSRQRAAKSMNATVADGKLALRAAPSFGTQEDLSVTVLLPQTVLRKVRVRSFSDVYIKEGLESDSLDLVIEAYAGSISAKGIVAHKLAIKASGISTVSAEGQIKEVTVEAEDTSSILLQGVRQSANFSLNGVSQASIISAKDATISGTVENGKVVHKGGVCSVKNKNTGAQACKNDDNLTLPSVPQFTKCTITIQGEGTQAQATSKTCQLPTSAEEKVQPTRRKLMQGADTSNAFAAAQALLQIGSLNSNLPTSYTYSSTSTANNGEQVITSCSFVNNNGGCQVNGVPVPPAQVISSSVPAPGPAQADLLNRVATVISDGSGSQSGSGTSSMTSVSSSSTSSGGSGGGGGGASTSTSSCTFVNGVGGCTTG